MQITHHKALMDGNAAPPNSLDAVVNSLNAGADWIEINIHALKAGDYAMFHDEAWQGQALGAYSADEMRRADIPLLSAVVAAFESQPGRTQLQLDLKSYLPFPTDEPLERLLRLIAPIRGRVVISSPADWQLRRLKYLDPSVRVGFDPLLYLDSRAPNWQADPRKPPSFQGVYGFYDDHPLAKLGILPPLAYAWDRCEVLTHQVPGAYGLYVSFRTLSHLLGQGFDWAQMLHAAGMQLITWTVDIGNAEAESIVKQLQGVDNIITNTPQALRQFLKDSS